jgi:hypothetical protein|tara:strand:- start:26643 stop:26903 length:261 start_codon:yes stop_codon:yes gene_type:complete
MVHLREVTKKKTAHRILYDALSPEHYAQYCRDVNKMSPRAMMESKPHHILNYTTDLLDVWTTYWQPIYYQLKEGTYVWEGTTTYQQ